MGLKSSGMGLKSAGNYGAKKVLLDKFASSTRTFPTLELARRGMNADRDRTLVVCDGNVMMMQTPSDIDTLGKFVGSMVSQIQLAINAGKHVVVVFDEPENITRAKREEQNARDARRTVRTPVCSVDLVVCPRTDAYDRAALDDPGLNARLLMDHRAARSRFFDAVCVDVLAHFLENMPSTEGWSVTFDGIDARGARRSPEAPRAPGIMSSHPDPWHEILKRATPIGEGDLKLPDVCHLVARWRRKHHSLEKKHRPEATDIVLNMLWTIDTDSFCIELVEQSRRQWEHAKAVEGPDECDTTLLCLREPSRKRKGDSFVTPSRFQCIDMESFHTNVVAYLFGAGSVPEDNDPLVRAATLLFAVALALCGCDFVEVQGLRADLVMPAVRDVVRRFPDQLMEMLAVLSGDAQRTLLARSAVSRVVESYIEHLHNDSSALSVRRRDQASKVNDLQLLRAVWLGSYWSGNEFKDTHAWGFASTAMD
tara:strand:+ start:15837 stop:17279 length:1443 start_codon:yes stop_codon:yes gene_type:complete